MGKASLTVYNCVFTQNRAALARFVLIFVFVLAFAFVFVFVSPACPPPPPLPVCSCCGVFVLGCVLEWIGCMHSSFYYRQVASARRTLTKQLVGYSGSETE